MDHTDDLVVLVYPLLLELVVFEVECLSVTLLDQGCNSGFFDHGDPL